MNHQSHNLPIIGATGPSGANGGGQLAAIDRTYAVVLFTADGDEHTLTLKFDRPKSGPDGVLDLDALKGFDPKASAMQNIARTIHAAHWGVDLGVPAPKVPVIEIVEGGAAIVWRHVVSFRFLGEWNPTLEQLAVYADEHEHKEAA